MTGRQRKVSAGAAGLASVLLRRDLLVEVESVRQRCADHGNRHLAQSVGNAADFRARIQRLDFGRFLRRTDRSGKDLRGLIGMLVMALLLLVDYSVVDQRSHDFSDFVFVSALLLPPFVFGRITRRLALQSEQLERRQEWIREKAVRGERDRIARDLHDVIAHSLSAMVVQTAAAEDLVRTDPDRAAAALQEVASTGRRALADTGRLLHVIRDDADELGLMPAPGLDRLPELVESFRGNGLVIDLDIDGPIRPLPVGVDLSAYRIVQEALTNALKYAADATASLRLTSTPHQLSISTANTAGQGHIGGSGLGLLGMAERVSLFGGTLSHGLTGDGRFELTATLPITASGEPA